MAYSNRRSKRPIPGVCPCHGTAPHVYVKKSATTDPKKALKKGPRKPGGRPNQGRPSAPRGPQRGGRR